MKLMSLHRVAAHFRIPLLLAIMLSACASAPVQEMSDARQAVQAALQSGAATAAPAQMNAAQTALRLAERLVRDRQFEAARHYAVDARAKAIEAQSIAQHKIVAPGKQ
ncbi:MAG TPA: DUF4398 domain-containing protein [Steroidobacteraceae bacterium]|nr:DUF4398 domain-containing protein [Steroidobacteraceae bacterium]